MRFTNLLFIVAFLSNTLTSLAQNFAPSVSWQQCFGGVKDEEFRAMALTPDGGFIAAGFAQSADGDLTGNYGISDYWIVKTDSDHNIEWQKNYGGSSTDWARSIVCTTDGGYIIAGYSKSIDGDVTSNHGDYDYWILKLDASGNIMWQKSLGGSGFENAYSIIQASDGNYVVAGFTESNDGNVTGNHGGQDYWIVKLNTGGGIIWKKTFGGSMDEQAACIIESRDHCYVIAGFASSTDGDVTDNKGKKDFWIIKITSAGDEIWAKSYGGGKDDAARWLEQTPDGSYIITGYASSNAKDVKGNNGKEDYWIIKIDSLGALQWQKCFGGSDDDYPYYIHRCNDGSLLVAGSSTSSDGDVTVHYGDEDGWVILTDSMGNLRWQQTLGGTKLEELRSCLEMKNGSLLFSGFTESNNNDVSGNHGDGDGWMMQTCIPPLAIITDGSAVNSCKGNDVTLTAYTASGYSYQWNKNGTAINGATDFTYDYSGNAEADFTVSVNTQSCASTSATSTVSRYDNPLAYITPLGDLNICATSSVTLKANGSGYSYLWLKDGGTIAGATDKNYTAGITGNYQVIVTDQTTGCSQTSGVAKVHSSCKEEAVLSFLPVTVSPNPTGGSFRISISSLTINTNVQLSITDLLGRVLYQQSLDLLEEKNVFTITLNENFSNGIYLLTIAGDSLNERTQMVVKR